MQDNYLLKSGLAALVVDSQIPWELPHTVSISMFLNPARCICNLKLQSFKKKKSKSLPEIRP